MPYVTRSDNSRIFYEVYGGDAPALFCGAPLSATPALRGYDEVHWLVTQAFIKDLGRDYRLLLMDYPYGCGQSSSAMPTVTSVVRVAEDFLAVADAAGFDRFAWYGYSWGAVSGLQLALRTDRLTALIAAGFPPLDGPYELMLQSCRHWVEHPVPGCPPELIQQFVRYYEDLQGYDDRLAVPQIKVPCLTFVGDRDAVDTGVGQAPIHANIDKNRGLLEELGWQVHILRGEDHDTAMLPEKAIPIIRGFLRPILKGEVVRC
jgi:pimeloyl-ACP methyl ester carboxylesterase